MRVHDAAAYIVEEALAAVRRVPQHEIDAFLSLIEGAKSVVIFGRGRSGLVGRAFAMRLAHLGYRAYVVGETISPPVHEDDVVVLISGSGETFSVTITGQVAKKLGCKIISITGSHETTLARLSDLTVILPAPETGRRPELAPLGTLFEDACQLLFDGLIAELMDRKKETEDSMRDRHATLE